MLTKVCWVLICPLMLLAILIVSLYLWKDPLYGGEDGVGADLRPDLLSNNNSLLDPLPSVGPLGWLDTGGDLRRPGPSLGGRHVPRLPLPPEGEAGGGSHQALGARRQPGDPSVSFDRQNMY